MNGLRTHLLPATCKRQRGVVVLTITLIILVLTTYLVFISNKTVLYDLKISANDYRARQAFEAAEAGLAYAAAFYKENSHLLDANGNGVLDADPATGEPHVGLSPEVGSYFNTADNPGFSYTDIRLAAGSTDILFVEATGTSDDGLAVRAVRNYFNYKPLAFGSPKEVLASRLDVTFSGSMKIENAYGNLTVRTGGTLSNNGSADTYICDRCGYDDPGNFDSPDTANKLSDWPVNTPPVIKNSGIDIIENDPYLAATTREEFFRNYIGGTYEEASALMEHYSDADLLEGVQDKAIWFDGDLSLSGLDSIGTYDNPVTLVVTGDFTSGGGHADVYGFVYVMGNLNLDGNTSIYGSLAAEGTVANSGSGTLGVYFDPKVASGIKSKKNTGASIGGGWNDW